MRFRPFHLSEIQKAPVNKKIGFFTQKQGKGRFQDFSLFKSCIGLIRNKLLVLNLNQRGEKFDLDGPENRLHNLRANRLLVK